MRQLSINDPEGVVTAGVGFQAAGADGSVWYKRSGTGNTGWVKIIGSDGLLNPSIFPSELEAVLIPVHLSEEEANNYQGTDGEVQTTAQSVRVMDGVTPGGGLRLYKHGKRALTIYGTDTTVTSGKKIPRAFILDKPSPVFACTGNSTTDYITAPGNNFVDGDCIGFLSITGTANLATGDLGWTTLYYVRDLGVAGAGTFKVAATSGGAAVNWTGTFTAGTVQRLGLVKVGDWMEGFTILDSDPLVWDGGADFETLMLDATPFEEDTKILDMSGLCNLKKFYLRFDGPIIAGPTIDVTGAPMLEELRVDGFAPNLLGEFSNLRKLHVFARDDWGFTFNVAPLLEKFVFTAASGYGLSLNFSGGSTVLVSVTALGQINGLITIYAPTSLPALTTMTFTSCGGFTFENTTGLTALTALNLECGYITGSPITFANMVGLTSLTSLVILNGGSGGGVVFPASSGLVGTLDSLITFTISGQHGLIEAAQLALIAAALVAAGNENGTFTVEWNYGDDTQVTGDLTVLNGHLATLRSRGWNAPDFVEPVA